MSKSVDGNEVNTRQRDPGAPPLGLREAGAAELETVEGGGWLGALAATVAGGAVGAILYTGGDETGGPRR
jgi:hypothetical protein